MAWNGLGNEGAVPLGWALRLNRQLDELDISNNDIQERGAASVASFLAAVLTEIYLCNVCSCQEILRRNGRG
jgi:hypothetical protein